MARPPLPPLSDDERRQIAADLVAQTTWGDVDDRIELAERISPIPPKVGEEVNTRTGVVTIVAFGETMFIGRTNDGDERAYMISDITQRVVPLAPAFMVLCPLCGNKRCPKASDIRFQCTRSNDSGQQPKWEDGVLQDIIDRVSDGWDRFVKSGRYPNAMELDTGHSGTWDIEFSHLFRMAAAGDLKPLADALEVARWS